MKCYYCHNKLTDVYYRCWYDGPEDENTVCGEGDCWAEWIQVNMEEIEIEKENEND